MPIYVTKVENQEMTVTCNTCNKIAVEGCFTVTLISWGDGTYSITGILPFTCPHCNSIITDLNLKD